MNWKRYTGTDNEIYGEARMYREAWIFCRPSEEVITGIHVPGDVLP